MIEGIQGLTLDASHELSREQAAVDARLQMFRQHLHNQITQRAQTITTPRLGIRCSVVPVTLVALPRDVIDYVMSEPQRRFVFGLRSGDRLEAALPVHVHNRRTILRGLRSYFHHEDTSYSHDLFLDGTQNLTLVHRPPSARSTRESDDLFAGWTLGVLMCALRIAAASAERCENAAAEFCVEVQICFAGGGGDQVVHTHERRLLDYRFESITTTFPRYSFCPARGPVDVLNGLLEDLYRSSGLRHRNPIVAVACD